MRVVLSAACAAALMFAAGCGDDEVRDVGGQADPNLSEVRFGLEAFDLYAGGVAELRVVAVDKAGQEHDVTAEATLTLRGEGVARIDGGRLVALAPGEAKLEAEFHGWTAWAPVRVESVAVEKIEVRLDGADETTYLPQLLIGDTSRLRTFAIAGELEFEVGEVSYEVSDEAFASVAADGTIEGVAGGHVTVTASALGKTAEAVIDVTCQYPHFSPKIELGRVIPNLAWPAKWPDGTDFRMSMQDVYCHESWKDVETFTLVLSAGWCNPCTMYAQMLEEKVDQLTALGMQTMIIEVQTYTDALADLEFAWMHLNTITDRVPSIVAGDLDTEPASGFLQNSEILQAFPTVLVVRTRDMRIIADQGRWRTWMPLEQIAADPERDWTQSAPTFVNRCGGGDEEASEPNDTPALAATIGAGVVEGGICTDAPDFYRVDLAGSWTLELAFDHDVGDLDVVVWDEETGGPARDENGNLVGSATSNDVERFEHQGPALIAVQGYNKASAPYTLTIVAGE